MATADPANIRRVFGRLKAGATELGLTRDQVLRFGLVSRDITAEEYGGETVESIYGGEQVVFACVLREFDADMIQKVFLNASASKVEYPGTNRAGTLGTTRGFVLTFVPLDTTNHPTVTMYNAIPMLDETAELQLMISQEFGTAVVFKCVRDDNGKVYDIE